MNFIEKIIDGFNTVISYLGALFTSLFNFLADSFNAVLDLLEKPLSLLYYLLEAIFYAVFKTFDIVVLVVKIFVAFFQFIGALTAGVTRTISSWTSIDIHADMNFPSVSHEGFYTVMEILQPTGLLTVVPLVATGFLWLFFIIKMIGLFGGNISIAPFGNSSGSSSGKTGGF